MKGLGQKHREMTELKGSAKRIAKRVESQLAELVNKESKVEDGVGMKA